MPETIESQLHPAELEQEMPAVAETETMEDFVRFTDVRMEVLPAHENPYRLPADQNLAYHYSCKMINANGDWFVVYFSKGPGLRLWQAPPDEFEASGKPLHVPLVNIGTQYDGPLPPFEGENAEWEQMVFTKCSVPAPPNMAEVLDCVANDCFTIEVTGTFENWCAVMGGSADSLHAKKTYEACCQHRAKLLALLGAEQYHRLIHEMDRKVVVPKPEESTETAEVPDSEST